MINTKLLILLVIFTVVLLFQTVKAENENQLVNAHIIADKSVIKPGESFQIGILFKISAGAHMYWQNPGDAGLAPSVDWQLPGNFRMGDINWPVPEKLEEQGGLVVNIYENEVLLFATVYVPDEVSTEFVTIKANAEWMVCKEYCTLEQDQVEITLPVSQKSHINPFTVQKFKEYKDLLPLISGYDSFFTVSASWTENIEQQSKESRGLINVVLKDKNRHFVYEGNAIQWFRQPLDEFISETVSINAEQSNPQKLVLTVTVKNTLEDKTAPEYNWGILKFQTINPNSNAGVYTYSIKIRFDK